jgi:hypothetical protein
MRITEFLASDSDAGYSRSRPAIAASSPAPTLGRLFFQVFKFVDWRFAVSRRSLAIIVAPAMV